MLSTNLHDFYKNTFMILKIQIRIQSSFSLCNWLLYFINLFLSRGSPDFVYDVDFLQRLIDSFLLDYFLLRLCLSDFSGCFISFFIPAFSRNWEEVWSLDYISIKILGIL